MITLSTLGFGLFAFMLVFAAVLAAVQVGFDFPRMQLAGRVASVVLVCVGFGLVAVMLHDAHSNVRYYDALAWFASLSVAASALIAEVWLLKATIKDRQAAQHEKQRSPERYDEPNALGA